MMKKSAQIRFQSGPEEKKKKKKERKKIAFLKENADIRTNRLMSALALALTAVINMDECGLSNLLIDCLGPVSYTHLTLPTTPYV